MSWHGGNVRKSDYLVSHGNMSKHNVGIQGTRTLKSSCSNRPDEAWIQAFYKVALWCYVSILLIHLLQPNPREISLFWVYTDEMALINLHAGFSYYLLILTLLLRICHSVETDGYWLFSWELGTGQPKVELEAAAIQSQFQTMKFIKLGVV